MFQPSIHIWIHLLSFQGRLTFLLRVHSTDDLQGLHNNREWEGLILKTNTLFPRSLYAFCIINKLLQKPFNVRDLWKWNFGNNTDQSLISHTVSTKWVYSPGRWTAAWRTLRIQWGSCFYRNWSFYLESYLETGVKEKSPRRGNPMDFYFYFYFSKTGNNNWN